MTVMTFTEHRETRPVGMLAAATAEIPHPAAPGATDASSQPHVLSSEGLWKSLLHVMCSLANTMSCFQDTNTLTRHMLHVLHALQALAYPVDD